MKMKMIKGICRASAVKDRDVVHVVPPETDHKAVQYGITMSGRLVAAFDGDAEGEFRRQHQIRG